MLTQQNLQKSMVLIATLFFTINVLVCNVSFGQPSGAKPDLVARILEVSPTSAHGGEPVTIKWTITNQGGAQAGPSQSPIRIGTGDWLWTCNVPALSVGQSHDCEVPSGLVIAPTQPGRYTITVKADAAAQIAESNERNNDATFNLTVESGSRRQPDLTIVNFELAAQREGSMWVSDTGDLFYAKLDVVNQGNARAGRSRLQIKIEGTDLVWYADVQEIPSKGRFSFRNPSEPWRISTPGNYTVVAIVDLDGVVVESNEGNNQATLTLTVRP
jgi:subtilase family serine protease